MNKKKSKKKLNEGNLNFFKTVLTSLMLILIFSVFPDTINYIKNNFKPNQVVFNSSKQYFGGSKR